MLALTGQHFILDYNERQGTTAIQRTLAEVGPVADGVLRPPWADPDDVEFLGATVDETRQFAVKALERRLKVIGLLQAS